MNKLLLVGSSGHSKVIIDIFERQNKYEIMGLLGDKCNLGKKTLGYEVIGCDSDLPKLMSKNKNLSLFIAIGDNWLRYQIMKKLISMSPTVSFVSAIHPSVQIGKKTKVGRGVAIMAGSVVNSDTMIGDFSIINTKSSLDHDNLIGDFVNISPGVTTGGNVSIESFSTIGIGTTISHSIKVGKHTIIGANSLVMKDFSDNLIAYGNPAKVIRKRKIGEKYL